MTSSNQSIGFFQNIIGQHCHRRRAVTGDFIKLACRLLNKLGTYLIAECFIVSLGKINRFSYGDTIMGNCWSAVSFGDHNIATLWSVCYFHGIVEHLRSTKYATARIIIVKNFFSHYLFSLSSSCLIRFSSVCRRFGIWYENITSLTITATIAA
ncbi:hypothetical protein D3C85_220640 [compost metagenome]